MTILDTAARIVGGDREQTYGHPAKNLETIAAFWTIWLRGRGLLSSEAVLSFDDVACMMILLKTARLANDPWHKDSQVDICGYARLLERCQESLEGELAQPPENLLRRSPFS